MGGGSLLFHFLSASRLSYVPSPPSPSPIPAVSFPFPSPFPLVPAPSPSRVFPSRVFAPPPPSLDVSPSPILSL